MVGSRKLSNDEVEALLSGLDNGASKEDTPAVLIPQQLESLILVQRTFHFLVTTMHSEWLMKKFVDLHALYFFRCCELCRGSHPFLQK